MLTSRFYLQLLPLQALLKETSTFVHESGGCVRRLDYHGLHGIPQKTRKDGQWHDQGDLWTMWFDTNPKTLDNLHTRLRTDPRVLRCVY
jgi:small subunit ribosomal protein S6